MECFHKLHKENLDFLCPAGVLHLPLVLFKSQFFPPTKEKCVNYFWRGGRAPPAVLSSDCMGAKIYKLHRLHILTIQGGPKLSMNRWPGPIVD